MQEDVHEFNKILCAALEEKMKVTRFLMIAYPNRMSLGGVGAGK